MASNTERDLQPDRIVQEYGLCLTASRLSGNHHGFEATCRQRPNVTPEVASPPCIRG